MQNEECLERRMKMKEIKDDGDNDGRGQVRDKHIVKPETRRRQRTRETDRETEGGKRARIRDDSPRENVG